MKCRHYRGLVTLGLLAAASMASAAARADGAATFAAGLWNAPLLGGSLDSSDIIGGDDVQAGDPIAASTVLIVGQENGGEFICSGSLIAQNLVLTAAHCLGTTGKAKLAIAFRTDINGSGAVVAAKAQARPSDFVKNSEQSQVDWDDLAVLRLASDAPAGYAPAVILQDASAIQDGADVTLAGYGINVPVAPPNSDAGSGVLRKVDQVILKAQYGATEVLVSEKDKGACHGDSGGPAFVAAADGSLQLFGVTSRLTEDDPVVGSGANQAIACTVDMVYTSVLARAAWIQATAAKLAAQ